MITDYTKIFVVKTKNKQTEYFLRKPAGVHSPMQLNKHNINQFYYLFSVIMTAGTMYIIMFQCNIESV